VANPITRLRSTSRRNGELGLGFGLPGGPSSGGSAAAAGGGGGSFLGWNPLDKSAAITLSGSDFVATTSTTGGQGVRTVTGRSSGHYYCEITCTGAVTEAVIGFSVAGTGVTTCGGAANQWGYYAPNGQRYTGGGLFAYGASYPVGTVLGLQYNEGTMTMYKDNVSQGNLITGVVGIVHPHFSTAAAGGTPNVGTLNTGGSAFVYTPPVGAVAWG
jgi:hypothetical protein